MALERGAQSIPVVSSAQYKAFGPLSDLKFGNGATEERIYDLASRPERIVVSSNGPDLDWSCTTDALGNVETIADGVILREFGYQDYQYFLTRGRGPWGELIWSYDRIGNRLSEDRDGAVKEYDYQNSVAGNTALLKSIGATGATATTRAATWYRSTQMAMSSTST